MKVTIATGIFPPEIGGPATFLRELIPVLKERGFVVDVVTYGASREGAVCVPRDSSFRWFRFFWAVLKASRGSDLILATDTFSSGFPARLVSLLRRKRLVVRFVGDAAWEISRANGWVDDPFELFQTKSYSFKTELIRRIQRFVLRGCDVLTVSKFLRSVLLSWGVKDDRVTVVYNAVAGIDLPSRDVLRKKLGFGNEFVLLSVGRVTPYKGVDKIIRMCVDLKKDIPALRLVVVGDGSALDDVKQTASDVDANFVSFVGRKNEVETREFMKASDVLVLNSEYEGMSHTLLEAMSVGLPVVASNVCGNPELVVGRGLLFDYNDMSGLKGQILKFHSDRKLRDSLVSEALMKLPTRSAQEEAILDLLSK